jgi:hypothetical protein
VTWSKLFFSAETMAPPGPVLGGTGAVFGLQPAKRAAVAMSRGIETSLIMRLFMVVPLVKKLPYGSKPCFAPKGEHKIARLL